MRRLLHFLVMDNNILFAYCSSRLSYLYLFFLFLVYIYIILNFLELY